MQSPPLAHPSCLIYMSTRNDIKRKIAHHEQAGNLVRYEPRRRKAERRLYLCKQAVDDLVSPNSAFFVFGLQGRITNVLEHWVTKGRVWSDPAGKPRFLKPIFPPEPNVWEMLMIEPGAQVRLFFVFAEPDTIVVSHMRLRSFLGKKGSQNWRDAKNQCMAAWNSLFDVPPHYGKRLSDFVTENYDDFAV